MKAATTNLKFTNNNYLQTCKKSLSALRQLGGFFIKQPSSNTTIHNKNRTKFNRRPYSLSTSATGLIIISCPFTSVISSQNSKETAQTQGKASLVVKSTLWVKKYRFSDVTDSSIGNEFVALQIKNYYEPYLSDTDRLQETLANHNLQSQELIRFRSAWETYGKAAA